MNLIEQKVRFSSYLIAFTINGTMIDVSQNAW